MGQDPRFAPTAAYTATKHGLVGLTRQLAAEWGVQIAEGKNFMATAWWISVFPGAAIIVTGLGFSLLGDGLAALLRVRR